MSQRLFPGAQGAAPQPGAGRSQPALRAAITLGGFLLSFVSLWVLVVSAPERNGEIDPLIGALRLLLTLPIVAATVWVSSGVRSASVPVVVAFAVTTGALADWLFFEALSSFYGELPGNDVVETGFNLLVVLGVAGIGVLGERESARQRARERSAGETDVLTGLPNRQGLTRRYQALPAGAPVALVMLDLNDLKFVNDAGGHSAGDAHIIAAARALRSALPAQGFVGRWGGDEFVAVLPGAAAEEAQAFARAAADTAPRPRPSLGAFAVGVARTTTAEPFGRALALADQRMYESKASEREAEARTTGERGAVSLEDFSRRLELLDTPDQVLESGLELARDLLNFEGMTYYEYQHGAFVPTHFEGPQQHDVSVLRAVDRKNSRPGLIELAAATDSTVWSADYASHPQALPSWVALGLKSVVLTPVRCRGRILGVLGLTNFSTWRAVTPQVRRLLEAVALRLSHTLERLLVVEEARASLEGGMLGLGLALEARDLETAGHTQRVVTLAEQLGRALGLSSAQLGDLRQGAYLHDIGKLAIPDSVLLKPGRLDQDEWTLMQSHSARGVELAARIPALSPGALAVIRHHHERWDGQGYPDRLAGEVIPLLARIFAVCDVYDALTSERPYKRAWSPEAALAEIGAQSGKQFEPQVVAALLALRQQDAAAAGVLS